LSRIRTFEIRKIYVYGRDIKTANFADMPFAGFSLKRGAAFKKTGNYSGNFLRHGCKFSIINTLRGTGTDGPT
jgi:hypothetical protein